MDLWISSGSLLHYLASSQRVPPVDDRYAVGDVCQEVRFLHRSVTAAYCQDRKSTRLNSSHDQISYAVFCLKKKKKKNNNTLIDTTASDNYDARVLTTTASRCSL